MADIAEKVREVKARIARACERAGRFPQEVTLVAVTKGVGAGAIKAALEAGIGHLGENRVQEARRKMEELGHLEPRPTWHMVGHLQTNKAKTALEIFDIIHSVDSLRLAEALSRRAQRGVPILIQVNLSGEVTRSGFSEAQLPPAVAQISRLPGLEVKGLMTIAPQVADPEEVRPLFRRLRQLCDALGLEHLSMGMTEDFEVAVEEGATLLRIGRAIFGEREG